MNVNNKNNEWQRKKQKRVQTTLDDYIKSTTAKKNKNFLIGMNRPIVKYFPVVNSRTEFENKNENGEDLVNDPSDDEIVVEQISSGTNRPIVSVVTISSDDEIREKRIFTATTDFVDADETKEIKDDDISEIVQVQRSEIETVNNDSVEEIFSTPKNKNESMQLEETMSPVFTKRVIRRNLDSKFSPINKSKFSPVKDKRISPAKIKMHSPDVNKNIRRNFTSEISLNDSILNDSYHRPKKAQSPTKFKYKSDIIRNKDERKKLCGFACPCCKDYFDALDLTPEERERRMKLVSRHRDREAPPSTPEGFWDLSMPDTPELIARREKFYGAQKQPKR